MSAKKKGRAVGPFEPLRALREELLKKDEASAQASTDPRTIIDNSSKTGKLSSFYLQGEESFRQSPR